MTIGAGCLHPVSDGFRWGDLEELDELDCLVVDNPELQTIKAIKNINVGERFDGMLRQWRPACFPFLVVAILLLLR